MQTIDRYISREELTRGVSLDLERDRDRFLALFAEMRAAGELSPTEFSRLIDQHLAIPKERVLEAYRQLTARGDLPFESELYDRLRLRPVRTISGVAPIAVLTGPYPCPADCIFCPSAKGVPRSYLPDEPAVQRAIRARYDPFKETTARMRALENMGHSTDKIELLVIGATWSAYPKKY